MEPAVKEAIERIEEAMNLTEEMEMFGTGISLNLSNLGLTELPAKIWEINSLTYLDLRLNRFTNYPSGIGKWAHSLLKLDLGSNYLIHIPPGIGQLKKLYRLGLEYNDLTSLPPELEQLPNLNFLDLRGNEILLSNEVVQELTSNEVEIRLY